jgi:translation initiation factor IF-2
MTAKTAHKKIYQVAKEINISHETLIEYLTKRGHAVKSHMSAVDDEMMHDILSHFKKDKEVAEKHQRKIQSIRESRKKTEAKPAPAEAEPVKEKKSRKPAEAVVEEKPAPVEEEAVAPAEQAPVEVPDIESPEIPEPADIEAEAPPAPEAAAPAAEAPPAVAGAPPAEKKPESFRVRRAPKMGLKVMGKIDLDEVRKREAAAEGTGRSKTAAGEAADAEAKKKKKKKRIRTEAPVAPVEETDDGARKGKKRKKTKHQEVDKGEVEEAIKRTLAEMDDTGAATPRTTFKKKRKEKRALHEQAIQEQKAKEESILKVTEFVSVQELANLMGVTAAEVIKKCIELGLMVSINQRLDKDTITLVASEYGFEVRFYSGISEDQEEEEAAEAADAESLTTRPPVVTIMGHVDHGKTSLLDYIRQSNVVAGEAGGITQHIGAYMVTVNARRITFLDTPGHEAFTAMRARGAQLTDIVILVVAADDNVMPQTVEAISHAQAANVPIIIAINKTDKADANPDRIRQQLSEKNVLVEEWGGKYQSVEISARTGKNVNLLLEKILLEADVLDLKANAGMLAKGGVIEARVDRGKGTIATVLVQKGTLNVGDPFVAGIQSGRVRAMYDERGNKMQTAGPSTPVQIQGFDGIPQAGDSFFCAESEREAREISLRRQQLKREQDFRLIRSVTLDDLSRKIQDGQVKELKVVVKGDVDGSVGALADSLMKITHAEVRVNVIHRAVGAISESDVLLAAASGAIIIGFHVRPNLNARVLSEQENVDIRLYNIIYDAIEDVRKALEGLLAPEKNEEITATLEVRETFKVPKIGMIAGCYVQGGKITRGNRVRLIRDGIVVFEGTISSLRRFKDDVREVETGFECGLSLENFNDLKVGDTIEAFKIVETMRKLN